MHSSSLRNVCIDHRILICRRPFEDVHAALVAALPSVKPELGKILADDDTAKVDLARREWPKLWLFLTRDHGKLTAADGLSSKAMQYEIGNPLTAERMSRYNLVAGLYAPLRAYLYENKDGIACFEYDLPSSLFSQFGDPRIAEVGLELDLELESALESSAGY
jgi:hypothetical protein